MADTTAGIANANVLLLHGIWMRPFVMRYLGGRLKRAGLHPHYFYYHGVLNTPEKNIEMLSRKIEQLNNGPLYVVAHSLGGLLLLRYLENHPQTPITRIVLLGSPVNGSHVAETLSKCYIGRLILGTSKDLLVSGARATSGSSIGMVAGTRGIGVGRLISTLKEPRDGAVFLRETQAKWLTDHVAIHHSHTGMLFSPSVAKLILHYFQSGTFESA
jgi:pimeloyl-ACP methyl ester carboxylesterase